MKEPSYSPDMAAEIDRLEDDLIEAFAAAVHQIPLTLPRDDRDFRSMVITMFETCLGDVTGDNPGTVGRVLAQYLDKEVAAARSETAVRVLSLIIDDKTRAYSKAEKLGAEALVFASGLHSLQDGASQTEIGKKRGVCRAAVSRRVTQNHRQLGLHPSRGSKSPDAVETYRETRNDVVARQKAA